MFITVKFLSLKKLSSGTSNMNKDPEEISAFSQGINNKKSQSWEALYTRYYAALCAFTARMLNNQSDDVEDLVQDIFLSIWNNERKFENISELTNYLYRACYNNALIHIRNHNIRNSLLPAILNENRLENSQEAYALAVQEELIRQLHFYIQQLPPEQERIISLRLQGHSWNDIAEIMQLSINTVKTQKQRSYKFLREHLSEVPLLLLFFT